MNVYFLFQRCLSNLIHWFLFSQTIFLHHNFRQQLISDPGKLRTNSCLCYERQNIVAISLPLWCQQYHPDNFCKPRTAKIPLVFSFYSCYTFDLSYSKWNWGTVIDDQVYLISSTDQFPMCIYQGISQSTQGRCPTAASGNLQLTEEEVSYRCVVLSSMRKPSYGQSRDIQKACCKKQYHHPLQWGR